MPTGMGVASPKFSKSNRKPKKTKHCTFPNLRKKNKSKGVKEQGIFLNQIHMEIEIPWKEFKKMN